MKNLLIIIIFTPLKSLLFIIICAPLMTCLPSIVRAQAQAQTQGQITGFHLTGHFEKTGVTGRIYLRYKDEQEELDSTEIKDGNFSFSGHVSGPVTGSLYRSAPIHDWVSCYLDNENITVVIKDSLYDAKINSPLNDQYDVWHNTFAPLIDKIRAIRLPGIHDVEKITDSAARKEWLARRDEQMKKITALQQEIKKVNYDYILQHPDSYFSLDALSIITGQELDMNVQEADSLFSTLTGKVRNTVFGRDLAAKFKKIHTTDIGQMAPAFEQFDTSGHTVRLADFKGKYVLVDFWASWCVYCRLQNPHLIKVYNTYRNRNFTILGITLDAPGFHDEWTKAIRKDGLPWPQAGDLRQKENPVAKLYGINGIPQNVLIGPDGRIVAKDLTGIELEQKLQAILPKG